ncbi:MAG: TIGR03435 family protein [Terriglobus sp.]
MQIRHLLKASVALCLLVLPCMQSDAQQPDSTRFEVISVHPTPNHDGRPSMEFPAGGGFRANNVTVKLLIEAAYGILPEQIVGADGWLDQDQFAIVATAPEGVAKVPPEEQKTLTLKRIQNLLADRFSLKLREQAKLQSTYVLTVDTSGIKMEESTELGPTKMLQHGPYQIVSQRVAMWMLCGYLGAHLHGTVMDQTNLKGRYNFTLTAPPDSLEVAREYEAGMPQDTLLSAVREQLGLRLKTEKAEVPNYRVIRAAKPDAN